MPMLTQKIKVSCPECGKDETVLIREDFNKSKIHEIQCKECRTHYGVKLSLNVNLDYFYMRSVKEVHAA